MNPKKIKRIIEALILSHEGPMSLTQIKDAVSMDLNNETLRLLIDELRQDWSDRAIHLVQVSTGYRFQTTPELQPYLDRMRSEKPVQYSRAVLETLAIIAYRQPVTRGDIEDIRGVTVSSNIIKTLEERGWIDTVGHREVPGRPALLGTTKQFLNDLSLLSLKELPALRGQTDSDGQQLELVTLDQPEIDEVLSDVGLTELGPVLSSAMDHLSQSTAQPVHVALNQEGAVTPDQTEGVEKNEPKLEVSQFAVLENTDGVDTAVTPMGSLPTQID